MAESIEFEKDGKRWVLTAEHVADNADNRDATNDDLAAAGYIQATEYEQLLSALRWLPANSVINFCDPEGFLESAQAMGWDPNAKETDDD